ncbi:MAG: hypothetical protein M3R12_03710 [Actinomycetota bacterium]|nr:hypothetical protein [Actinomycetota bacterium]
MRKLFIIIALLSLALPVAGLAALRAGDGTLSVEDGRGSVSMHVRGGVIGRLDRGSVTIYDLTPADAYEQKVYGDDHPVRFVGETGIKYSGSGIRFRLVGGQFRIVVSGSGIDLSAVGKGSGFIQGGLGEDTGVYSLDGADCRTDRASCKPLPEFGRRFQLGGPEKNTSG